MCSFVIARYMPKKDIQDFSTTEELPGDNNQQNSIINFFKQVII